MTPAQQARLTLFLVQYFPAAFVHGGATGSDTQAHKLAVGFLPESFIAVHPASFDSEGWWRKNYPSAFVAQWEPPLKRNHKIVDGSEHLLATPAGMHEERRSGTWATIRYARKQEKPITIIYPDGGYVHDGSRRR